MSRIFLIGDAGCTTGFGRVNHSIGERLVRDYGHEVHVLATNHLGDSYPSILDPSQQTPLRMYRPNSLIPKDVYGRSRIVELLGKLEPDVVWLTNDASIIIGLLFQNQWDKEQYLLRYRPILAYIPIDGYNHPPIWGTLASVTKRIAMSRFGQSLMPEAELIYHGVDHDLYRPIDAEHPITLSNGEVMQSKRDCKIALGYDPDGFLVLRVDRNSGRKDFPATWSALQPVMKRHTDIQVHFHCQARGDEAGVDLPNVFSREPETKARFFTPGGYDTYIGWTDHDLAALYNAADLFVTTSRGEGFGLTIAEALACGVPVIAQNVSAIPEVVGPGGVLIEPQRPITVPSGQDLWLADIGAFSEEIEHLYSAGGVRRKLGAAGREHVVKSFNWDTAAGLFHEYIEALASGTGSSEATA